HRPLRRASTNPIALCTSRGTRKGGFFSRLTQGAGVIGVLAQVRVVVMRSPSPRYRFGQQGLGAAIRGADAEVCSRVAPRGNLGTVEEGAELVVMTALSVNKVWRAVHDRLQRGSSLRKRGSSDSEAVTALLVDHATG